MRFVSENLGLSESTFRLLRDLIDKRTGVKFDTHKLELLKDKLANRVIECGLDSFLDYYYLLKYDVSANEEWKHLIDAISVQETFFWREVDKIQTLCDVLVPQYFAKTPNIPLTIWSAACATGEEPLSIAIALNEKGWFDKLSIKIYATDVSESAIKRAQRGIYRERSFRSLPIFLKTKYFQQEHGGWRVKPELHNRVQWSIVNLVDEADVKPLATAPVIFCRNVFIYFSPEAISKTIKLFWEGMPTPGYLFVGASESLLKLTTDFQLQEIKGAFVYVKQ